MTVDPHVYSDSLRMPRPSSPRRPSENSRTQPVVLDLRLRKDSPSLWARYGTVMLRVSYYIVESRAGSLGLRLDGNDPTERIADFSGRCPTVRDSRTDGALYANIFLSGLTSAETTYCDRMRRSEHVLGDGAAPHPAPSPPTRRASRGRVHVELLQ